MAISSFRLRRALPFPSSILSLRPFSVASAAALSPSYSGPASMPSSNLRGSLISLIRLGIPCARPSCAIQSLSFRSSAPSYDRRPGDGDDRKIDPDEILFEGCDYNHWLITMEFPKDPKPTPEEMVETYVQTLAKVVGSVEEAKKRMYACSTTTYQGFQAVMTEEMSEKFRGLPGVVFILPDSYIDPVNKEYGGDKYDNGVITPRPPPVQYGRQGRYGDRNRNYDRPRFDRHPQQQQQYQQQYQPAQQGPPPQQQYQPAHQGPPPQQPNYGRGYGPGDGRDGFQRGSYPAHEGRFPQGPPPPPPPPQGQGYGGGQGGWDGPNR